MDFMPTLLHNKELPTERQAGSHPVSRSVKYLLIEQHPFAALFKGLEVVFALWF